MKQTIEINFSQNSALPKIVQDDPRPEVNNDKVKIVDSELQSPILPMAPHSRNLTLFSGTNLQYFKTPNPNANYNN